jgi:ElaB/YqjD/DUF883 family membrane-anchored ribosome-binding protein
MNEQFWGDMLTVLKDIGSYLEKQDATQERAKISTPPKIAENPKPIKGGDMPAGFKPADRLAKEYVPMEEARDRTAGELSAKEQTLLKENLEGEPEEEIEETPEDETFEEDAEDEVASEGDMASEDEGIEDEDTESMDELKSLLKDIRSALMKQSNVADVVKAQLKKDLPNVVKGETDKMLRKMGFIPTRPDVAKIDVSKSFGLDTTEETKEIKKSTDKQEDMSKILNDMSKKSWTELGQLREKTEGFSPFGR